MSMFKQLVHHILTKLQQERTVSSVYHLLKGKKSGQTLEDVGMYHLHAFYHLLPKLKRSVYDEVIVALEQEHKIQRTEQGYILHEPYEGHYHFNGWIYRGKEHLFFERCVLVTQTLSHVKAQDMHFTPMVKSITTQQFVKQFLQAEHYHDNQLTTRWLTELKQALQHADLTEMMRVSFVYRLSGHALPGYTWQQLADAQKMSVLDMQIIFIESLHIMMQAKTPLLLALQKDCITSNFLTVSSRQTYEMLQLGYTIEQISQQRALKINTIQDHIVEIARNVPGFSLQPYVQADTVRQVWEAVNAYQTFKLKTLQEILQLPYFELKLALTRKGE